MENDNHTISPIPVLNELLLHLHNQGLYLPPAFNENIIPMLHGKDFTTVEKYTCLKTKEGILDRAKWISKGYGYAVCIFKGENGEDIEVIVDVFRPKFIMLDEDGFFNNKPTNLIYKLAKGTTAIPFSRSDFAQLATKVPEAQLLATKILSALHTEERKIREILNMKVGNKKDAIEEHFGIEIYQYFNKKDLAPFFGMAPETMSRRRYK